MNDPHGITQLLTNLKDLNSQKQYQSACILGNMLVTASFQSIMKMRHQQQSSRGGSNIMPSFFMSSCDNSGAISQMALQLLSDHYRVGDFAIFCQIVYEYAVALRHSNEPMRAILYLTQSISLLQSDANSLGSTVDVIAVSNASDRLWESVELLAWCQLEANQTDHALKSFESMPLENRSISVHMKMGEIYEKKASPLAIPSFQNVLKMNPYSLHAVAQLVNLSGAQVNEMKLLYPNEASNPFHRWIHHFIDATYAKKHHKFKVAMKSYECMNQIFPNNPDVLAYIAECRSRLLDINVAKDLFEKVKSIDKTVTCEMASYALLLRRDNKSTELQDLAFRLLNNSKSAPETWATLAIHFESKGHNDKALKFAQKSIDLNDKFVIGYLVKANVLTILGKFAEAVSCYHKVHYFSRDIRIYQGLVGCYMAIPQLQDAKAAATMAQKLHPYHFKSAILLGAVLNTRADTRELARAQYQKAIQLCQKEEETPRMNGIEEAILGLAEVESRNNNIPRAIQMIKEQLQKHNTDNLHMKLGELCIKSGDHTEASVHLHNALHLNPHNEQATRLLEELELLMQPGDVNNNRSGFDEEEPYLNDNQYP